MRGEPRRRALDAYLATMTELRRMMMEREQKGAAGLTEMANCDATLAEAAYWAAEAADMP